jgi:hypothetical protein
MKNEEKGGRNGRRLAPSARHLCRLGSGIASSPVRGGIFWNGRKMSLLLGQTACPESIRGRSAAAAQQRSPTISVPHSRPPYMPAAIKPDLNQIKPPGQKSNQNQAESNQKSGSGASGTCFQPSAKLRAFPAVTAPLQKTEATARQSLAPPWWLRLQARQMAQWWPSARTVTGCYHPVTTNVTTLMPQLQRCSRCYRFSNFMYVIKHSWSGRIRPPAAGGEQFHVFG